MLQYSGRVEGALSGHARPQSESLEERNETHMKHAIIETGGKQYRVAEGDVIFVEKLCAEAGETVKFDRVLAVIDEDSSVFGTPVVGAPSSPAAS